MTSCGTHQECECVPNWKGSLLINLFSRPETRFARFDLARPDGLASLISWHPYHTLCTGDQFSASCQECHWFGLVLMGGWGKNRFVECGKLDAWIEFANRVMGVG